MVIFLLFGLFNHNAFFLLILNAIQNTYYKHKQSGAKNLNQLQGTQKVRCQGFTINQHFPTKKYKACMIWYLSRLLSNDRLHLLTTKIQSVNKNNRCISRKTWRHLTNSIIFQVCVGFCEECGPNLVHLVIDVISWDITIFRENDLKKTYGFFLSVGSIMCLWSDF